MQLGQGANEFERDVFWPISTNWPLSLEKGPKIIKKKLSALNRAWRLFWKKHVLLKIYL